MAGIYIHIPYCRQKCIYCNFFSLASKRHADVFVPTIIREMELRNQYLGGAFIETIYLGGGTPSLLEPASVKEMLDSIQTLFKVAEDAEITLEANPDDLGREKLRGFRASGINRLSIGIQSFIDEDLHFLNRVHSAGEAIACIREARDSGFSNLSIDLIYGIPGQDYSRWEFNLKQAFDLDIPHISAYALTVEERTPLEKKIAAGALPAIQESLQEEHFDILCRMMEHHGYLHYEISNFCRPGMFARHNTSYWNGIPYLGLGPSAHSYDGESRQWNLPNLTQYVTSVKEGMIPSERELLSKFQQFNEYIMTSLRTMWGCDLQYVEFQFGPTWKEQLLRDSYKYLQGGMLSIEGDKLLLTRDGKFRADGIASDLFRLDEPSA